MTTVPALLLVADEPVGDRDQRLLWAGLLLVIGLLVAAVLIAIVDRWRRRMLESDTSDLDALGSFRLSYERGELSETEYRAIKTRLAGAKPPTPARPERRPASPAGPPAEGRTPDPPAAE